MTKSAAVLQRICTYVTLTVVCVIMVGVAVLSLSAEQTYQHITPVTVVPTTPAVTPFPIGVDPDRATITEQVAVEAFYDQELAAASRANNSWWNRLAAVLQTRAVYQQLASPVGRLIVIWPGERTEEITQNTGDVLRWSQAERAEFASLMADNELEFEHGFALPGRYTIHRYATPEDIATLLDDSFATNVRARYTDDVEAIVPLADALIIASLLEREASDFENMRDISGVIWNRLFIDMPLQLDASLQYVKAENPYEPTWWPAVRPADKFIDSPFNTYQHTGLPPEPIANPSVDAIVAALNPRVTECLFYFHSRSRDYYCSETYEEHVTKLNDVYGL